MIDEGLRDVMNLVIHLCGCEVVLVLVLRNAYMKNTKTSSSIEEYSAKMRLSPIWFISRKMAKQDFVYHCWKWLAVTLK